MPVLSHRKPCPCYYCVLDLPNVTPSQTEITKAFKNMARICHPDKVPEAHKQAAHEQFCNVQKAHSVLGDASLRKGYDLDQMPKYYSAMDFQQDPKDHGKYGRNPQKKQYTSPAPPPPPRPRGKYTDTPDVDPDLWESPPKPRPAPKYRSSTDPYGGPGAKAQHDRRGKSVWGREDPNDEAIGRMHFIPQ
ncbi:hypothetical protein EDC01DRAFT_441411 [Geopyxis carbonaria]|nr:hypothetical protein EDC01DRAFT_441411 [Geopyxis carbonaria]